MVSPDMSFDYLDKSTHECLLEVLRNIEHTIVKEGIDVSSSANLKSKDIKILLKSTEKYFSKESYTTITKNAAQRRLGTNSIDTWPALRILIVETFKMVIHPTTYLHIIQKSRQTSNQSPRHFWESLVTSIENYQDAIWTSYMEMARLVVPALILYPLAYITI
jgi:hypothetical protein